MVILKNKYLPITNITVLPPFVKRNRELVYKHWFRIYVLEMNRNRSTADFYKQEIKDNLEPNSWIFVATSGGGVVGSLRLSFWNKQSLNYYVSLYKLSRNPAIKVAIGTRLMVAKEYRKLGIAASLISRAKRFIDRIEHSSLIVDCNPPVDHLFEKQGFTKYASRVFSPEYGDVELLVYHPMHS